MSKLGQTFVVALIFIGGVLSASSEKKSEVSSVDQKLRDYLSQQFEHKGRIEVDHVFYKGTIPAEAQINTVDPKPSLGWVSFEMVWQEQGEMKRAFGTASVKLYVPVAVAKRPIKSSDPFNQDNVAISEREVSPYRVSGFFYDLTELQKLRARIYLNPGTVISPNNTQVPFMVSSGEMVALVKETPTVKVSMRVKALENGRENQWIRIENSASKKVMQARVANPGEVSLH